MYFIFVIELKKQFDNKIVGKLNIFQFWVSKYRIDFDCK